MPVNKRRGENQAYRRDRLCARVKAYYDTCHLCGRPVDKSLQWPDPWCGVVDEIIPVSRGGSPIDWNNVQLAHNWCNRIKSNHSNEWARIRIRQLLNHQQPKDMRPTSLPLQTSGDW